MIKVKHVIGIKQLKLVDYKYAQILLKLLLQIVIKQWVDVYLMVQIVLLKVYVHHILQR